MKKTMSFAEQIQTLKVVTGAAWICVGVFSCINNPIFTILQIVALLVCIVNVVRVSSAEKEESDEMAQENLYKAKAKALDLMHGILGLIAIAAMLFLGKNTVTLDWAEVIPAIFFIILGIQELMIGITFRKLEEE